MSEIYCPHCLGEGSEGGCLICGQVPVVAYDYSDMKAQLNELEGRLSVAKGETMSEPFFDRVEALVKAAECAYACFLQEEGAKAIEQYYPEALALPAALEALGPRETWPELSVTEKT